MSDTTPIRLIAGLGNPGDRYSETRHNAGFWYIDALADKYGGNFRDESRFQGMLCQVRIGGSECWLLKPLGFMNRSGQSIGAVCSYYKIEPEAVLVAHDELDLDPGVVRLKIGGGHGGHNGLRDTHRVIGADYKRIRIGIGHPGDKREVTDYVLKRASREDALSIRQAIERAVDETPSIVAGDSQQAMNRLHQK